MLSICTHACSQSLSPLADGRVNNKVLIQLTDAIKLITVLLKPEAA